MVTTTDAIKKLAGIMISSAYPTAVRAGAAEGLGFAGGPDARESLAKVVNNSTYPEEVRVAAAKALGRAAQQP